MIYLVLILSFIGIGFFGFGGPEAILCFLYDIVVAENGWLTPQQFADLLIVSKTIPGETSVNAATLTGYAATLNDCGLFASIGASMAAMTGLATPAYVWAELTHRLRIPQQYKEGLTDAIALLRMAIPGLIGAIVVSLVSAGNIGTTETPWQLGISVFIMTFVIIGNLVFRINALTLLLLSAVAGILLL